MSENTNKLIDKIKFVADKGDADSQYFLAVMYDEFIEYKNKKAAFKYFLLAAANGVAEAQYKLGDIYYSNNDYPFVNKSLEEAFKYYKLAADNGYPLAQYKIANLYNYGLKKLGANLESIVVVAVNKKEALKYYKLAVDNGVSKALINVLEICLSEKLNEDFEKYYILASNNENELIRLEANQLVSLSQKTKIKKNKFY